MSYAPLFDEPYKISAGGGYNDHQYDQFQGIDLIIQDSKNTYNKPVYAAEEGYGYAMVDALGAKYWLIHKGDLCFFYVHLESFVGTDRYIQKGELIGYAGNSGFVRPPPTPGAPWNGTHLHYMVWENGDNIDPTPYINFDINNLPFTQKEMDEIIVKSNLKFISTILNKSGDTWISTRLVRADTLATTPYKEVWYVCQTRYSYDGGKTFGGIVGSGAFESPIESREDDGVITQTATDAESNSLMRTFNPGDKVFSDWKFY